MEAVEIFDYLKLTCLQYQTVQPHIKTTIYLYIEHLLFTGEYL